MNIDDLRMAAEIGADEAEQRVQELETDNAVLAARVEVLERENAGHVAQRHALAARVEELEEILGLDRREG